MILVRPCSILPGIPLDTTDKADKKGNPYT